MLAVHRIDDARICGATTVPADGSGLIRRVFVNGKIISLNGDPNSHAGGALTATATRTFVNMQAVVRVGDPASPDSLCPIDPMHCNPFATTGSPNVFVGA